MQSTAKPNNVIDIDDPWYQFYVKRINTDYQKYFEERYKPFLDIIRGLNTFYLKEEGCGIGSVIKAIPEKKWVGTDLSESMLHLASLNTGKQRPYLFKQCIVTGQSTEPWVPIWYKQIKGVVSHGVLEHFDDDTIIRIIERQKSKYELAIHYVPLEGYVKPSFGDERLLPLEHWLELVNPAYYEVFNVYDLLFIV